MAYYLIFFNQQWVGDHSEEWFRSRGPLANAVTEEMKAAGVYVFAGGLVEELDQAFSADATSGEVIITDGPRTPRPRSGSAGSRSSTSPTSRRRRCGRARWPSRAGGPKRSAR